MLTANADKRLTAGRKRLAKAAEIIWHRRLPYGLLSTRFLWPGLSEKQALHLQLTRTAKPRLPRLLFWPINIWIMLRWLLYRAWHQTFTAVRYFGPDVRQAHGIGLWQQFAQALPMALAHSIPPLAYYQFRFYERTRTHTFWDYIHSHELSSFHRRHDNPTSVTELHLLSDKLRFADEMQTHGVTISARCELLSAGSTIAELPPAEHDPLFCKPRVGSRAQGAFRLDRSSQGTLRVYPIASKILSEPDASRFVNELLLAQDYLVQPCYANHPDMRTLDPADDEAITLRVITRSANNTQHPYCAYLELPFGEPACRTYLSIQVDTATGLLLPESLERLPLCGDRHRALGNAAQGLVVPQWAHAVNMVSLAHTRFANIETIAWDLIFTPSGPVLLEGNSNWRIDLPQIFCGGLLAEL